MWGGSRGRKKAFLSRLLQCEQGSGRLVWLGGQVYGLGGKENCDSQVQGDPWWKVPEMEGRLEPLGLRS